MEAKSTRLCMHVQPGSLFGKGAVLASGGLCRPHMMPAKLRAGMGPSGSLWWQMDTPCRSLRPSCGPVLVQLQQPHRDYAPEAG